MNSAPQPIGSDRRFSRAKRLLNAADYSRVFEDAQVKASHPNLLLLARPNQYETHRIGLVIAKKNVKLAVERNRIKRVAREFFRHTDTTAPFLDVVLLARRDIGRLENKELSSILQQQWLKMLRKAGTQPDRQES
jgi:ribonuclease P protein component